jgi:DNA-binding transcriptional MocR family regulator
MEQIPPRHERADQMALKRYEALAEDIAHSIRSGVLKLGDRLPSVRAASAARGVSASTVFEAYYLLEARGVIRARERSGDYVTASTQTLPPEPESAAPASTDSTAVDVSDLVFSILESAKARDVVPFGSAFPSPELFPLQRLARSVAWSVPRMDPWSTVDDLTPGSLALRRQIALRYLADGLHVHPDDIVITNGALEALNLCLMAVARPGDSVVVESPTFYAALQALERLGMRAIEVPTHPRDGIDLDALAQALERHKPKACWLMPNFQNPLGYVMSDARKAALVALLAQHAVPLVEDDVYGELYYGDQRGELRGNQRPAFAKSFDSEGLVMHCSSFSKCLAPGYRIGWAVPGRFTRDVTRLKLTTTLSTSAPGQAALADYLAKGGYDKHLRQLRHTLALQRDAMVDAVARYFPRGTKATRPAGGYFLWIELPGKADALELHRQALSLGISVAPGPMFSAHRGFTNCLRLNYGHAWDARAQEAIQTLGKLAAALMRGG